MISYVHFSNYRFFTIAFIPSVGSVDTQQSLVSIKSASSGTVVHPGDDVTFECTTVDSSIIAWSSDEYIGRGGIKLELIANDTSVHTSQITTATAVLFNTSYNSNGAILLMSTLTLTAKRISNFSVTCFNIGRGTNISITVNVSGMC